MTVAAVPGFYGKMPSLGDFVSRRLPHRFIERWDDWLDSAFSASREQLGPQWLNFYLTSPIWRFGFTGTLLGDTAWAGILMPSVDKVGRYFPLTIAIPLADGAVLPMLFEGAKDWFGRIEQLALSCLEDDFDLNRFDATLQETPLPELGWARVRGKNARKEKETDDGRFALRVSVEAPEELSSAFSGLGAGILDRFSPSYSLWCTEGSERVPPSLLVCDGLPPIDAYAAFLGGRWPDRGWNLGSWTHASSPDPFPEPAGEDPEVTIPYPMRSAPKSKSEALPRWRWFSHGITDTGCRRKINEDAFLARPEIGLWAVADGMGGHQAGEVASAAVVDGLAGLPEPGNLAEAVSLVSRALDRTNEVLRTLAAELRNGEIIGSTAVVLLIQGDRGSVLWAGDSRLYRFRAGNLEQLTKDHSLLDEISVQDRSERGGSVSGARCNIITRAVGAEAVLELDRRDVDFRDGDIFLLCSDGLDKELESDRIASVLGHGNEKSMAEALITAALEQGARDNVTVVVIRCERVN